MVDRAIGDIRRDIMRRHPDVFPDEAEILEGPGDDLDRAVVSLYSEAGKLAQAWMTDAAKKATTPELRCGCGGTVTRDHVKSGYRCDGCGKFLTDQMIANWDPGRRRLER
jgi:hypothetical protein